MTNEAREKAGVMIAIASAIFAFITQLFIIIWGAAKLDAAVDVLQEAKSDLQGNLSALSEVVQKTRDSTLIYGYRIKLLEDKIK